MNGTAEIEESGLAQSWVANFVYIIGFTQALKLMYVIIPWPTVGVSDSLIKGLCWAKINLQYGLNNSLIPAATRTCTIYWIRSLIGTKRQGGWPSLRGLLTTEMAALTTNPGAWHWWEFPETKSYCRVECIIDALTASSFFMLSVIWVSKLVRSGNRRVTRCLIITQQGSDRH